MRPRSDYDLNARFALAEAAAPAIAKPWREGLKINATVLTYAVLAAVTILAVVVRFASLGKLSLWHDEIFSANLATMDWGGMFRVLWDGEINMALFYVLLHLSADIFGSSDAAIRVPSAIASVMAVPAVFFLARAFHHTSSRSISSQWRPAIITGLLAALLITVNPVNIQYAQEARSYSLVILLGLVSTLLFVKSVERHSSWSWWVFYGIVSVLLVYAHIVAAILIAAHALSLLPLWRWQRTSVPVKHLAGSWAIMVVLVVPLLVAAYLEGAEARINWVEPVSLASLHQTFLSLSGTTLGMADWVSHTILALYASALLLGTAVLVLQVRRSSDALVKWKGVLLLLAVFGSIGLAVLASLTVWPVFVPRFLLFTQPFLILIMAVGLAHVRRRLWPPLILALLGVVAVVGVTDYHTRFFKQDIRGVARLVEEHRGPEVAILYYHWRLEDQVRYYEDDLVLTVPRSDWMLLLGLWGNNPTTDDIKEFLLPELEQVNKVVLVEFQGRVETQKSIRAVLDSEFPVAVQNWQEFFGPRVWVYSREGTDSGK